METFCPWSRISFFLKKKITRAARRVLPTFPFYFQVRYLSHPFTTMATNSIKLLTGNSHPELAKLVADRYVSIDLC